MNPSPTGEDIPLKPNLPKPSLGGMSLSDIPVFKPSTTSKTSPALNLSQMSSMESSTEPASCEDTTKENVEGKFEYEFTNLWDGCLYSVYLYDTNDVSACERVLNRPVKTEELVYSETGNGFVVDGEFKYTFCKNPIKRIAMPQISCDARLRRRQSIQVRTADDILAEL